MMQMDPRKQFSKRLARYGAVVWGLFLLAVMILLYFQPETALACVYLVLIVTANKALDTWAYTKNSTYEKGLMAMKDITKMELSLKGTATNPGSKSKTDTKEDDSEDEGEGGNG